MLLILLVEINISSSPPHAPGKRQSHPCRGWDRSIHLGRGGRRWMCAWCGAIQMASFILFPIPILALLASASEENRGRILHAWRRVLRAAVPAKPAFLIVQIAPPQAPAIHPRHHHHHLHPRFKPVGTIRNWKPQTSRRHQRVGKTFTATNYVCFWPCQCIVLKIHLRARSVGEKAADARLECRWWWWWWWCCCCCMCDWQLLTSWVMLMPCLAPKPEKTFPSSALVGRSMCVPLLLGTV